MSLRLNDKILTDLIEGEGYVCGKLVINKDDEYCVKSRKTGKFYHIKDGSALGIATSGHGFNSLQYFYYIEDSD